MKKRILSLFLAIALLFTMLQQIVQTASAAEVVASGSCGEQIRWTLDDTGTLTLTGQGAMDDYGGFTKAWNGNYAYSLLNQPWSQERGQIRKVVVEEGITYIGDTAFASCKELTSVELPNSLSKIGDAAFEGCTLLEELTLPSGVVAVDRLAFAYSGLKTVFIPVTLTTIADSAFNYCNSITEVNYAGSQADWENIAFGEYNWPLINANITYGKEGQTDISILASGDCGEHVSWILTSDGILAISGSGKMKSWGSYKQVPWYDFAQQIRSVRIKNGVTTVGECAFAGCDYLTSVTLPDSITKIYLGGFAGCERLAAMVLPEGVEEIGDKAFADCKALTTLTMPASITYISFDAFQNCNRLTDVYYGGSESEWNGITMYSGNQCLTSANIHYDHQGAVPQTPQTPAEGGEGGAKRIKQVNVTYSDGTTGQTQFTYNEQGLLRATNMVSPYLDTEQKTVYEYDDAKRLTSIRLESGLCPAEYVYDSNGFLIESSRTEGSKVTQHYENDSEGRCVSSYTDGEGMTCESEYSYNGDGTLKEEIQTQTDFEGNTVKNYISYFYDGSGKILKEVYDGAYYSYIRDYSYQYAPFVAISEDDTVPYCLYLPDVMGNPVWMIEYIMVASSQTDSDGYLSRIVTDYGDIYDFIYEECKDAENTVEVVDPTAEDYARTQWIEKHIEYAGSAQFKEQITPGFNGALEDALEDIKDNGMITAYNTLDSINTILDFDLDLTDVEEYELLLAQILFSRTGTASINEIYDEYLSRNIITICEILVEHIPKRTTSKINKKVEELEKLLKTIKGMSHSDIQYNEVLSQIMDSISNFDDLNFEKECIKAFDKAGLSFASDFLSSEIDTVESTLSEVIIYMAAGEAYCNTSDAFGEMILALRKHIAVPSDNPIFEPYQSDKILVNDQMIWTELGIKHAGDLIEPDPLNTPIYLSALAKAIENYYTQLEASKAGNASIIAQNAMAEFVAETADNLLDAELNVAVSLLECIPVVKQFSAIKALFEGTQFAVDTFTSVDNRAYLGTMVMRLYGIAYIHYLSVEDLATHTDAWGTITTVGPSEQTFDVNAQFADATQFDEAVAVYRAILSVAAEYAEEYYITYYEAANSIQSKYRNRQPSIPAYVDTDPDTFKSISQKIIELQMQKNDLAYEWCHSSKITFNQLHGVNTYDSSEMLIFSFKCPVSVTFKNESGEVIASLSNENSTVGAGYEQYFFTSEVISGSGEYVKIAAVPKSYEVVIEGTGTGRMDVLVSEYTNGQLGETKQYLGVPVSEGSSGYFRKNEEDGGDFCLIMDDTAYTEGDYSNIESQNANKMALHIAIMAIGVVCIGLVVIVLRRKKTCK